MLRSRARRLAAAASLLLGATLLVALPVSTPAYATTTVTTIAGGGSSYGAEGIAATSAQLGNPQGIATDTAGNVYVADRGFHTIREVTMPADTIATFYGTPGTAKLIANGGLYQPSGVTVAADGSVFIADTLNQVVWKKPPTGDIVRFAGNNQGAGGFAGDGGSATASGTKLNQPAGLAYDNASSTLYIVDQYNCVVRKVVGGNIYTVAGIGGSCGYTGEGTATSFKLNYPTSVKYWNGKLYIADTSNCRIRVVDLASNAISTLAGTGTCSDSGDNGAAASAAVNTPKGVDVDAMGYVYIGTNSGNVRRVKPTGVITTIATVTGSVQSLSLDRQGNIYTSNVGPGTAIRRISGYSLDNAIVSGVSFSAPSLSDPLLKRGISVSLVSGMPAPDHYEYSWTNDPWATAPSGPIRIAAAVNPLVDYRDTSPTSLWSLFIRGVATNGGVSVWYQSGWITTPKAPLLLAIGDSVTSGHNRLGLADQSTCEDANYGYPRYVRDAIAASLPSQWAPRYENFAYSGFSTSMMLLTGQEDACHVTIPQSPLAQAQQELSANVGSWNYVVATGGIDDTDWVAQITEAGTNSTLQGPFYKEQNCASDLADWSGWDPINVGQTISNNVSTIVDTLRGADSVVKIDWLGYYNIANTGPISAVCELPMNNALDRMAEYVSDGLSGRNVTVVDSDIVMHMRYDRTQVYHVAWGGEQGWPHPETLGAQAIAGIVPL